MKDSANVIEETVQKYALKNGKNESLGRNDPIWQMYKSYHVGRAVKGVESEIGVFQKEQAQFIKISKKQNMSEEDMLTLVRKQPDVALKQSLFGTHRALLTLVAEVMQKKSVEIELEQMMMSGVNSSDLSVVSDTEMLKQL